MAKKLPMMMVMCAVIFVTGWAQGKEVKESTEIVKVKAKKKVLALIKTWDEKIWFFTSKENPIKSLNGLKKDEIACWGAEHIERVFDFLDAVGIKYEDKAMRVIGTGNPIFSGMKNPPRLFITWSDYAQHLKGGIKVIFIEEQEKILVRTSSTIIYQAQQRLKELGYDPGPLDGVWGKKTERAVKEFQRDNGLSVTGKLDGITKEKLNLEELPSIKAQTRILFSKEKVL